MDIGFMLDLQNADSAKPWRAIGPPKSDNYRLKIIKTIVIEWANALVPPTPPFVGEVGSMLGTGPQFQDGLGVAQRASHAEAL